MTKINLKECRDVAMAAMLGWRSIDGDEGYAHLFLRRPDDMVISVCGSLCVPETNLSPSETSEKNDVRCGACSGNRK